MTDKQFERAMYRLETAMGDAERYAALAAAMMLLLRAEKERQEKAPDLSDRG